LNLKREDKVRNASSVRSGCLMTAKIRILTALRLGLTVAISFTPNISNARHKSKTESRMDRAMQQLAVSQSDLPDKPVHVNKAEEAAYKAFLAAQNSEPSVRIQLGEDFAVKFPTSNYLSGIYGVLTTSYFAAGDTDKMFTAGSKAMQLDPENVDVMAVLAMAIPRRVKSTTQEGAQRLQTAEAYAHRAIEIIPTLTKPANLDDASFEKMKNDKLALAHSGLGLIAIGHQKYDGARTELTQAVQLASSPDPVDYYLLGNADVQGGFYNDAVAAYENCAATGPLATECRARAESAKHDRATKLGR